MTIVGACLRAIIGVGDVKAFWRIREVILTKRHSKILSLFCSMIRRRYGAGIPVSDKVKPFISPHGFHGIFISEYASVDEGCTIFQQVTIGQNGLIQDEKNAPIIGANCYIGAGAKIIGPCTLGENVRVGANAIVVDDIPPNTTVVLNKPRIIFRSNEGNK